jgi:SRSO17 transposase
MTVDEIERVGKELPGFLHRFDGCFRRPETRTHVQQYVRGQLSNLPRKSLEPIALAAGIPPRTLQQCFAHCHWDEDRMRNQLEQIVAQEHAHAQAIGILDETSYPKKGQKTPGVQRQHCGATGKIDNCLVSIHLSYATPEGLRVLLDSELYLPQSWENDLPRRQEAGIPDSLHHRPAWQIALDLLDRARGNGVVLPWICFDEGYGKSKQFLLELDARGLRYVGEVPVCMHGWCKRPEQAQGEHSPHWRKTHSPALSSVENLAWHSPAFTGQPWQTYLVRDGTTGPIVWRAKAAAFHLCLDDGTPSHALWLIVAQNTLEEGQIKYFLSNAPPGTPPEAVIRVGLGRYPVERCFEDEKTELGLDHFEMRLYRSLKRHWIVTSLSSLFLAKTRERLRGEKPADHGLPDPHRGQRFSGEPADGTGAAAGVPAAAV